MGSYDEPVTEYMCPYVRAVTPDTSLQEAWGRLEEWKISCLAVVELVADDYQLRGVVSRTDLIRAGHERRKGRSRTRLELPDAPVSTVMSEEVVRVDKSDSLSYAAARMVEEKVHRVFVEDDSGVVGVLSTRDIMRSIGDDGITRPISEVMTSPVAAVHSATTIEEAIDTLEANRISGVVVLDKGWPCGVFTQEEVLRAHRLSAQDPVADAMSSAILVLPESTALHRAAANAASVDVRRIIVTRNRLMVGILGGLDFCRAIA